MRSIALACAALAAFLVLGTPDVAEARLDAAQRRTISEVRRDLTRVRTMLRKDEIKEAEEVINSAIAKITEVAKAAMVDEKDPSIAAILKLVSSNRAALIKAKANSDDFQISFESDVAPLLKQKCGNCHGDDRPQGGLNLSTWRGLRAGGQSRQPFTRVVLSKLTTSNEQQRMPKGQAPLERAEIEKIALWLEQGGKFDGKDQDAPIGSSGAAAKAITIAEATPRDTVSFSEDIAPWFSNLCLRCHNGNGGRSGFSVATIEDIMKGGDSGRVVIPGDLEGSRLFRLVGGLENPRMPQGQARITRDNYNALRTWILEGARFDGEDPKTNIRNLVPSEEEKKALEFAELSPEEFLDYRKERADELWDKALKKSRPGWAEGEEVYVFGNVGEERLTEIATWAEAQAEALRKTFRVKSGERLWKGKLTIFVTGDRFDFEEFVLLNTNRRAARTMYAMTRVTTSGSDAYVAIEDIGDDDTGTRPPLKVAVIDYMTGAFLERNGGKFPEWVKRGTGLALAKSNVENDLYLEGIRTKAKGMVASLAKPEDVFSESTFAPGTVGPVGVTIIEFLIENGGGARFVQFLGELESGKDTAAAMNTVYKQPLKNVAAGYLAALNKRR